MTHLSVNPKRIKSAIIELVAGSLEIGQIVVLPTDTVYGLSCLADDSRAIKKIYHLKKRDSNKPVLILVSDLKMAKKYTHISRKQALLLGKLWAKKQVPTTVILHNRFKLPRELSLGSDGLAVRLPKSKFLIKIIEKAKCPIVSARLSFSGQKNITNLHRLHYYFPKKNNRPDLVIDAGPSPQKTPSRLIDLRNEDEPLVLRK